MRARGAAHRGLERDRPRAGGGRPRHRGRAPRAGDVPAGVQVRPRLGPAGRGRARPRRAAALSAARQGDRRLELDQRDDLPARQPARLRRLGGRRRDGVELRRGAPVLQALRGQRARRERVSRRRRAARRLRQPFHEPPDRRPARGCGAGGLRADRRPDRRSARGRVAVPAHAEKRPALQRRRRVPPPGRGPAEPRGHLGRLRRAARVRGQPRRRRPAREGRCARDRARRARGDRLRRRLPVARAADALGHRPARPAGAVRDPGAPGTARRPQPPGPRHGQRQLPHRPAGTARDLHARRTSRCSRARAGGR